MNVQNKSKTIFPANLNKTRDMQELHRRILQALPKCKLCIEDGKNSEIKRLATLISDMDLIP